MNRQGAVRGQKRGSVGGAVKRDIISRAKDAKSDPRELSEPRLHEQAAEGQNIREIVTHQSWPYIEAIIMAPIFSMETASDENMESSGFACRTALRTLSRIYTKLTEGEQAEAQLAEIARRKREEQE